VDWNAVSAVGAIAAAAIAYFVYRRQFPQTGKIEYYQFWIDLGSFRLHHLIIRSKSDYKLNPFSLELDSHSPENLVIRISKNQAKSSIRAIIDNNIIKIEFDHLIPNGCVSLWYKSITGGQALRVLSGDIKLNQSFDLGW